MLKKIIIFSITLTSCSFAANKELQDLKFEYVSTKKISNDDIETIIKTSRNLQEVYKQKQLFLTYANFDCKINPKYLGEVNDGKDKLSGVVRFKEESKEGFLYSIRYIAVKDHNYISLNEYFSSVAKKSNKLYCQYQAYFYEIKPFKSKIFEIPIKDFLKD
ncbi:hypothetical protein HYE59_05110 [Aggregatibacter actinomycetemcomitans]|uniref:hypothetical protein n=1 Tax=Aggregatibacter actinomycetemcomitans TaxID=714 RepID=UPI00197B2EB3|nr:hypothetical protein [Aggregatibacter actinomycetemcomitans]MBN6074014.1 hypothetical protein [Aggregatibacter actinomycetemcomitans]MBN6076928.1 hypothetical protein [Aggregatibacter actinomycetemcomitans]